MIRFRLIAPLALASALIYLAGCATAPPRNQYLDQQIRLLELQLAQTQQKLDEQEAMNAEERLDRIENQIGEMVHLLNRISLTKPPQNSEFPAAATDDEADTDTNAAPDTETGPMDETPPATVQEEAIIATDPYFDVDRWSDRMRKNGEKLIERFAENTEPVKGEQRSALVGKPLPQTRFLGPNGKILDIDDFKGKKPVALIFMRGFWGQVCIACSAHTVALANAEEEFAARGAQVLVVFPGEAGAIPSYLKSVRDLAGNKDFPFPYPVLLDVGLTATNTYDIRGAKAKPTSIIVDKRGVVRYAYVGKSYDDRPSAPTLLAELDKLDSE